MKEYLANLILNSQAKSILYIIDWEENNNNKTLIVYGMDTSINTKLAFRITHGLNLKNNYKNLCGTMLIPPNKTTT